MNFANEQCSVVLTELDMGRVGSGRVQIFSLLNGLGQVGFIYVGLCGSLWIIQNVTPSVVVKFTQFSEVAEVIFCIN